VQVKPRSAFEMACVLTICQKGEAIPVRPGQALRVAGGRGSQIS